MANKINLGDTNIILPDFQLKTIVKVVILGLIAFILFSSFYTVEAFVGLEEFVELP